MTTGEVRLRIDLAYDGTAYHGWARQPGLQTVQGELEAALATVLRLAAVDTTCAGRTDAGVHARGQVVHVDVPGEALDVDRLARRLNGVLPVDVRVRGVVVAPRGFDARFSPLWRRYCYRLADPAVRLDPLTRGWVVAWPRPLDTEAMQLAAGHLLGEHDFAAFCKRREGATTVRELLELRCERDATGTVAVTVRADAFCHSMVRSLLGALVTVGEGRRPVAWVGEVLTKAERDPAVQVMPAGGLVLEEVAYPDDPEVAARATATRRVREPARG